jgi:hypothetical protein
VSIGIIINYPHFRAILENSVLLIFLRCILHDNCAQSVEKIIIINFFQLFCFAVALDLPKEVTFTKAIFKEPFLEEILVSSAVIKNDNSPIHKVEILFDSQENSFEIMFEQVGFVRFDIDGEAG